ncbi:MAG: serine/threonine protein kinase [Proteobacteria bacterium]|nr:serine/threonine protein kinase [Pseudomonadota bacterium]
MSNARTREHVVQRRIGYDSDADDEQTRVEAETLVGRVIDGRYKVLKLIGQGGMGSVYKAEHTGIRRIVALKLLHPGLAQVPEVSQRFKREAEAIGRIKHPNCVYVSDSGKLEDGSLYLVMEYLDGRALSDVLADEYRIEPLRTLRILRHVLCGLGHAHESGIVHRDVKPENVLLVPHDGDPDFAKILDFGIAKLLGTASKEGNGGTLTQAGMAFGTPVYMSPEQAVGNPIDGRADLYAATIMAYEMITGQPPFHSDDKLEIMTMHTSRPVPPMYEVAPEVDVPPQIEQLLLHGLAKRPAERFADAGQYVAAIDTVLAGLDTRVQGHVLIRPSTNITPLPGGGTAVNPLVTPPAQYPGVSPGGPERPGTRVKVHRDARRARRHGIIAVLSTAVVGILIAVIATSADDKSTQPSLATQAAEKLSQGDPQGAIALLVANEPVIARDAAALLELGHAYAATRANSKAVVAYRKSLTIAPGKRRDDKLRKNLEAMLDDRRGQAAVAAFGLWAEYYRDIGADNKLIALAANHKNNDVRRRVVQEVRRRGLDDQVDWIASYALDLQHGANCEERRKAIPRLRATDDKRAISVLKKAVKRKERRGKSKRYRLVNRCLREDAKEAVQYLSSLVAADAGPKQ